MFELLSSVEYLLSIVTSEIQAWENHRDLIEKSNMIPLTKMAGTRVCNTEIEILKKKKQYLLDIRNSYTKLSEAKTGEADSLSTPEGGGSKPS